MFRSYKQEGHKPFNTGLGESRQDIAIEYNLDARAPYREEFPYNEVKLIRKDAVNRIFEVERISDKKVFAAMMRFNPSLRPEMNHEEIFETYKDFLTVVEVLSNNNHKNVTRLIEALRDKNGNMFIITKLYKEGNLHDKMRDSEGKVRLI